MSRFTIDRKEPRRQRSGPWYQDAWLNSRIIGPQHYQSIDRQQQARELWISPELPTCATAMVEPGAAKQPRKDKRRQRTVLSTWEDEDGKNG